MATYSFKLPDLGEGIVESEIVAWYIKPGDNVEEDQHIADVTTDKAMVEISSPVSGTVIAVACEADAVLAVGNELVRFEVVSEGNVSDEKPLSSTPPETVTLDEAATPDTDVTLASPSVRQRARDEGIELSAVPGSGPAGRIGHKDLEAFIAARGLLALPNNLRTPRLGHTDIKIKGLRRVIAQKMQQAMRNIPHYSYIEEVDVTNLEELRQYLNASRGEDQPRLTLLPFIMQALVKVLPQFPHCNAHFDDESGVLTQHEAVHVGIATMTNGGLMAPVVRHCESLDIWQAANELSRVTQAARDNVAKVEQLSGSTITITSLGAIGGIATTPVINAPETAIIGVNKLQERPVVKDGAMVVRKMMNLSSSFDHRIVDGFDGAQLVQALKHLLENPGAIFI